jgi:hypothetical protein
VTLAAHLAPAVYPALRVSVRTSPEKHKMNSPGPTSSEPAALPPTPVIVAPASFAAEEFTLPIALQEMQKEEPPDEVPAAPTAGANSAGETGTERPEAIVSPTAADPPPVSDRPDSEQTVSVSPSSDVAISHFLSAERSPQSVSPIAVTVSIADSGSESSVGGQQETEQATDARDEPKEKTVASDEQHAPMEVDVPPAEMFDGKAQLGPVSPPLLIATNSCEPRSEATTLPAPSGDLRVCTGLATTSEREQTRTNAAPLSPTTGPGAASFSELEAAAHASSPAAEASTSSAASSQSEELAEICRELRAPLPDLFAVPKTSSSSVNSLAAPSVKAEAELAPAAVHSRPLPETLSAEDSERITKVLSAMRSVGSDALELLKVSGIAPSPGAIPRFKRLMGVMEQHKIELPSEVRREDTDDEKPKWHRM